MRVERTTAKLDFSMSGGNLQLIMRVTASQYYRLNKVFESFEAGV